MSLRESPEQNFMLLPEPLEQHMVLSIDHRIGLEEVHNWTTAILPRRVTTSVVFSQLLPTPSSVRQTRAVYATRRKADACASRGIVDSHKVTREGHKTL